MVNTRADHISAAFVKLKVVENIAITPNNYASPIVRLARSHKHHLHLVRELPEIRGSGKTHASIVWRFNHVICTIHERARLPSRALTKHLPLSPPHILSTQALHHHPSP